MAGGGLRLAFPRDGAGRRSTTPAGRAVAVAALAAVDPTGALAARDEPTWRTGYVLHHRRLVEAGLASRGAALAVARAGLAAVAEQLVATDGDEDREVAALASARPLRALGVAEVVGEGTPQRELVVPYRDRSLRGAELEEQLGSWADRGVLEPSAAEAVLAVARHPEWLALPGRTVAALGAGSELGPVAPLLRWGATVAAVDLPGAARWTRLLERARSSGGRLLVPSGGDGDLASGAGADLLSEVPEVAEWVAGLPGRPVVGNYLYADGGTHVLVSAAADLVVQRVLEQRPDAALAFLATPTDAFAVPAEAVAHSVRAYEGRSTAGRWLGRPVRWATRGRLLHRNYRPGADPGVCDALVPAQGPSYALAKRIQRWRASVARDEGVDVSFHVAPASRTASVVKNRALAAAYAGAHRFGVEVFDPRTADVLMAALLVHDLAVGAPRHDHPWQDEAHAAVHGGLWRSAYAPRSALGVAAVLGYASR